MCQNFFDYDLLLINRKLIFSHDAWAFVYQELIRLIQFQREITTTFLLFHLNRLKNTSRTFFNILTIYGKTTAFLIFKAIKMNDKM